MSNTNFGYKSLIPVSEADMEAFVNVATANMVSNTQIDPAVTFNNIAYFPNSQTKEIKTSSLLQQSATSTSLTVNGQIISTDSTTALYGTNPNITLGTALNPFKRIHTSEISSGSSITLNCGPAGINLASTSQIHGVADPTSNLDAANKKYVDSTSLTYTGTNPVANDIPVFTGVGKQVTKSDVLTTPGGSLLRVSGNVEFDNSTRFIGNDLTPATILFSKRLNPGSTQLLTISSSHIDLEDSLGAKCCRITVASEQLKIGGPDLRGCEIENFIPLQHYPSASAIVLERTIYSTCFTSTLSTPNTNTNYLTEFPALPSQTYGNLTIPALSTLYGGLNTTIRFRVQGVVYSQTTSNHKLNLTAAVSQDVKFMNLFQNATPDVQPTTDGGVERAFEWVTIMRFPLNVAQTRGDLFVHSTFTCANNSMGSMVQSWAENGGSSAQRIDISMPFNVNIGLAWVLANANKYIKLHQVTVTMSPY
jgi:hypothetical protein